MPTIEFLEREGKVARDRMEAERTRMVPHSSVVVLAKQRCSSSVCVSGRNGEKTKIKLELSGHIHRENLGWFFLYVELLFSAVFIFTTSSNRVCRSQQVVVPSLYNSSAF